MKKLILLLLCFVAFNTANSENTIIKLDNCETVLFEIADDDCPMIQITTASRATMANADPCGCDASFDECILGPGPRGQCIQEFIVCVLDCIWPF